MADSLNRSVGLIGLPCNAILMLKLLRKLVNDTNSLILHYSLLFLNKYIFIFTLKYGIQAYLSSVNFHII